MRWVATALAAALGCGSGADTDAGAVAELFAGSCGGSLCHVFTDAPAEGLDLSAGAMCDELIGVASVQSPEVLLVAPGDPDASYLLCKIDPGCADRNGTSLMPLSRSPLSAESIDAVARWIADGAPGCGAADSAAPQFSGADAATGLSSAIGVEWSPASDDATPAGAIVYEVYEADARGGQDFSAPSYVSEPGATSLVAVPLPISTTRYYVVRARDAAGNLDDNRIEVSATTLETADETPPQFAGIEAAVPAASTGVTLSWSPATDDVAPASKIRYRAYIAMTPGGQDFSTPTAESEPGATEMLVTGLTAETDYHAVVRAVDALDNEEGNTVERAVTTGAAVSFSADVQPIFDASCGDNACHGGVAPAEGLDLSPGTAYAALVGIAASQCANRLRVAAGDPDSSYLIDKLRGVDLCSGTRMPKGAPLPGAQIQLIVDWVAQGAPDN